MKFILTAEQWAEKCLDYQLKYKAVGVLSQVAYKIYPTGTKRIEYLICLWDTSENQSFYSEDPENALKQLDEYMSRTTANYCPTCGQRVIKK